MVSLIFLCNTLLTFPANSVLNIFALWPETAAWKWPVNLINHSIEGLTWSYIVMFSTWVPTQMTNHSFCSLTGKRVKNHIHVKGLPKLYLMHSFTAPIDLVVLIKMCKGEGNHLSNYWGGQSHAWPYMRAPCTNKNDKGVICPTRAGATKLKRFSRMSIKS